MLAMLLAAYLFYGGVDAALGELMTHHVKDQINSAIADEDRRKLALKGLSAVNDNVKELNKELSKDVGRVEKLIKNYDSQPVEFDRQFASVSARRQQQVDKIWDDRRAMLQHIRPEEWRAIMSGARAAAEKKAAKKK